MVSALSTRLSTGQGEQAVNVHQAASEQGREDSKDKELEDLRAELDGLRAAELTRTGELERLLLRLEVLLLLVRFLFMRL